MLSEYDLAEINRARRAKGKREMRREEAERAIRNRSSDDAGMDVSTFLLLYAAMSGNDTAHASPASHSDFTPGGGDFSGGGSSASYDSGSSGGSDGGGGGGGGD